MMLRSLLIIICLAFAAPQAMAQAESPREAIRDAVVEELRRDGYSNIRLFRTLLGRMRFTAERPGYRREIVVHPRTGLILRDYTRLQRGGDGDDDKDDDDEEEAEDEEEGGSAEGHDDEDDDNDDDDDDGDDHDDEDDDDDDDDDDDE